VLLYWRRPKVYGRAAHGILRSDNRSAHWSSVFRLSFPWNVTWLSGRGSTVSLAARAVDRSPVDRSAYYPVSSAPAARTFSPGRVVLHAARVERLSQRVRLGFRSSQERVLQTAMSLRMFARPSAGARLTHASRSVVIDWSREPGAAVPSRTHTQPALRASRRVAANLTQAHELRELHTQSRTTLRAARETRRYASSETYRRTSTENHRQLSAEFRHRMSASFHYSSERRAAHPSAAARAIQIAAIAATRSVDLVWRTRPSAAESGARTPPAVSRPLEASTRSTSFSINHSTATTLHQRTEAVPTRPAMLDPALAQRVADDVIRRIDLRERIERERRGL
jgi:hypothetical protein